ncbi:cysteine-rich receptor-like protein kinase 26 [Momordica charantia]|uniref:Cysteine-rich receptor-like protein kinase 26 n=1 Tax=Momordica charantia TaxID=3673 RepID=A0A6J1CMI7_MOMCH|nr:cysteine-rich receptor-like protein kinase 26 [Momordica charantia]
MGKDLGEDESQTTMAFYLLPTLLILMAKASAQPSFISHLCIYDTGSFTANSTFKTNLDRVLSSIATDKELDYGFYRFSYGQSSDAANAVGLCGADIKLDACQNCLNDSVHLLTKLCPHQKEAISWCENCSLHYSSRSLSDQMDTSPVIRFWSSRNISNTNEFISRLRILLSSLKSKASIGGSLHTVTDDRPMPPPTWQPMAISTPSSTDTTSRAVGKKNVKTRVHIVIIMVLSVVSCWVLMICIYIFLRSRKTEERIESN